jgi:pyruvate/2-oxoacid:ferredoxin oxidoreductase beta subunit
MDISGGAAIMGLKEKKLPRVFDYFIEKDQFAGGNTFCAGCPAELTLRIIPRVLGKDDVVLVGTPCCAAPVLHGQNLGAWHKMSYYACVMTGVASSASGLARYYQKTGRDVTVCCFTGDGDASDIGFQTLSGAAERNEHVMYVCYDNEGYMNTGNQRSSMTPLHAATSTTPVGKGQNGKTTVSKNLPLIMALHPTSYVATATLSNMEDYVKKLLKAKEISKRGFAYIHVFSPCVVGFKIDTDSAIQVCRMAVRTNYFPLWEMEDGQFRITTPIENPRPINEYLSLCGKFSHFKENDIVEFQRVVDERYAMIKSLVKVTTKTTQ